MFLELSACMLGSSDETVVQVISQRIIWSVIVHVFLELINLVKPRVIFQVLVFVKEISCNLM